MQFTCRYGDKEFRYAVCYRPTIRKKVVVHIHPNGSVQVDAPSGTANVAIKEAVQKRARWVTTQLEQLREQKREVLPRRYVSGESHFYQGRRYPLKILQTQGGPRVSLCRGQLRISTMDRSPQAVKTLLWQWYRAHAHDTFQRRLGVLAQQVSWLSGQRPLITLRTMKKRWGSCSPRGHIVLNPHLVKAPRDCIDYVIIHELCHLKEHNHSPQFYQWLSQLMPDWKAVKSRLDGMAELLLNA